MLERISGEGVTAFYRDTETGVFERHFEIDTGKGGEPVNIVQITDVHFNLCDEVDEGDEELMRTKQCRHWNANGASAVSAQKAMAAAKGADQIIVTGDTLDYLSHGARVMTEKYIWGADPNAIIVVGGHDYTKEMQTGVPNVLPVEERLAMLQSFWRHDIYYVSKTLGDKVTAVCMFDNGYYPECVVEPFLRDIADARANGRVVLIFQHEPISTFKPEDRELKAIRVYPHESLDYYGEKGCLEKEWDDSTNAVIHAIRTNSDVIRGIFVGHHHSAFYSEVLCEDGSVIPQLTLEGNCYDNHAGHLMRITVR